MIMSLPSLIIMTHIWLLHLLMVIVPLAWRVASWLHVPSPSVIGMLSLIVVKGSPFCYAHVSSRNVVFDLVSINASLSACLPHRSFYMAGRVISLSWPGLFLFPSPVRFSILGLQGYSLPLQSGNCSKCVQLSHIESISCFLFFYLPFFLCPVPWGLFYVLMFLSCECFFLLLSACQVHALPYFLSPEHHVCLV